MLIILKVIQSNLSKHKDIYIHVNSLAILGNMSRFVIHIPSIVSSKLMTVLELVSKRYWKLFHLSHQESLQESLSHQESLQDSNTGKKGNQNQEKIYLDILILILEILNSIMIHNLNHNPHLVYLRNSDYIQKQVI